MAEDRWGVEDNEKPPPEWAGWSRNAGDKDAWIRDSSPGIVSFVDDEEG